MEFGTFRCLFRISQENEEEEENIGAEEEPLCSDDDVSEEENQNDLFDTDNVVVCLYDKVCMPPILTRIAITVAVDLWK